MKYKEPYFSASSRTGKTISPSEEEKEKRREMHRKLMESDSFTFEAAYKHFVTDAEPLGEEIDKIIAENLHKYLD